MLGLLIRSGMKAGASGEPMALSAVFGWVLVGRAVTPDETVPAAAILPYTISDNLSNQIQKFWIEEVSLQKPLSAVNEFCENYFKITHSHDADGRNVMRLPIQADSSIKFGLS